MTIKIVSNEKGNPPGKLADAELVFTEGPLEGLKLIGFSVWERKTGASRSDPGSTRAPACRGAAGGQSPYIFCFISRRCCASSDSVAVGRASRRGMPIGSPVSSQ